MFPGNVMITFGWLLDANHDISDEGMKYEGGLDPVKFEYFMSHRQDFINYFLNG